MRITMSHVSMVKYSRQLVHRLNVLCNTRILYLLLLVETANIYVKYNDTTILLCQFLNGQHYKP